MKRKHKIFGYELILDLYHCDLPTLQNKEKLCLWVKQLCELIDMKTYGKTIVEYFGTAKDHTKGYSVVQLIETSAIVGHFSEYWRRAYLNIFSCKEFDHLKAVTFTKSFFRCKKAKYRLLIR